MFCSPGCLTPFPRECLGMQSSRLFSFHAFSFLVSYPLNGSFVFSALFKRMSLLRLELQNLVNQQVCIYLIVYSTKREHLSSSFHWFTTIRRKDMSYKNPAYSEQSTLKTEKSSILLWLLTTFTTLFLFWAPFQKALFNGNTFDFERPLYSSFIWGSIILFYYQYFCFITGNSSMLQIY